MNVAGHVAEEGEEDVDEEICAAACYEEDADGWDYGEGRGGYG